MPSGKQGASSSKYRKPSYPETPLTSRKELGIVVKSIALTSSKIQTQPLTRCGTAGEWLDLLHRHFLIYDMGKIAIVISRDHCEIKRDTSCRMLFTYLLLEFRERQRCEAGHSHLGRCTQHQYHLGACYTWAPPQTYRTRISRNLCFNKLSRWLLCPQVWEAWLYNHR